MNERPTIFHSDNDLPTGPSMIEAFDSALGELFFVENPQISRDLREEANTIALKEEFKRSNRNNSVWILFPWRNTIVHTLNEQLYFRLRTARNREIITEKEQQSFRDLNIGIGGLSVGSAILSTLVMSGGPKNIKIADFDTLEVSNLNRIRATLLDVGLDKTQIAMRSVWEVDPFAELEQYNNGLHPENIEDFLLLPKLDVFVDEMDSIDMKIESRIRAKENGIPVIMGTDNGDGVIVDVERFDLDPTRPIFHGLIGAIQPDEVRNLKFDEWLNLANQIIDPNLLGDPMLRSIAGIGKTISAIPQLGASASMVGSVVSFLIRRIGSNDLPQLQSGRYVINMESMKAIQYE